MRRRNLYVSENENEMSADSFIRTSINIGRVAACGLPADEETRRDLRHLLLTSFHRSVVIEDRVVAADVAWEIFDSAHREKDLSLAYAAATAYLQLQLTLAKENTTISGNALERTLKLKSMLDEDQTNPSYADSLAKKVLEELHPKFIPTLMMSNITRSADSPENATGDEEARPVDPAI